LSDATVFTVDFTAETIRDVIY